MSYHLAAWAMDVDVPPREKLMLILIASYANDDGECFPSQTTLAYRSGLSRRTVLRSLAEIGKPLGLTHSGAHRMLARAARAEGARS